MAIEATARWEALDTVARKGPEAASELLLGHSAELASSALARDQLLSVALDQAADAVRTGSVDAVADLSPFLCAASLPVTERVQLSLAATRAPIKDEPAQFAASLVTAYQRKLHAGYNRTTLDGLLREDALLNEIFWADPRIPADERSRVLMIAIIPQLHACARLAGNAAPVGKSERNLLGRVLRALRRR